MRHLSPAAVILIACAGSGDGADEVADDLIIAKLELQDAVVWVTGGDAGPRYTLLDRAGRVLARDLDAGGLAQHHPGAAEALEAGWAGNFDARLDARDMRPAPAPWTSGDESEL
jgi:hypothetical protein